MILTLAVLIAVLAVSSTVDSENQIISQNLNINIDYALQIIHDDDCAIQSDVQQPHFSKLSGVFPRSSKVNVSWPWESERQMHSTDISSSDISQFSLHVACKATEDSNLFLPLIGTDLLDVDEVLEHYLHTGRSSMQIDLQRSQTCAAWVEDQNGIQSVRSFFHAQVRERMLEPIIRQEDYITGGGPTILRIENPNNEAFSAIKYRFADESDVRVQSISSHMATNTDSKEFIIYNASSPPIVHPGMRICAFVSPITLDDALTYFNDLQNGSYLHCLGFQSEELLVLHLLYNPPSEQQAPAFVPSLMHGKMILHSIFHFNLLPKQHKFEISKDQFTQNFYLYVNNAQELHPHPANQYQSTVKTNLSLLSPCTQHEVKIVKYLKMKYLYCASISPIPKAS
ncbi:MAG: hypothetical protein EZS28_042255 [Streblomastix strix]|uniref:Uncharacterized protein n=1 Tax=Streblomastix strix TaxID=222440 RepID=A0A5J4TVP0_9EUKA|nr:MAG: hypothetical protein EZS28_042255 [Streblomastix strix]